MRIIFKPIVPLLLAGAFVITSVLCCCVRHLIETQPAAKAASCCHTKTAKTDPSSKKTCDGCSSVLKSSDTVKVFDLTPVSLIKFSSVATASVFTFKPVHTIAPVFVNGPPGPLSIVPLYTQFHSLRI
jgi:hypothetical protein